MFSRLYNTYIHELFAYGTAMGIKQEELKDIIHDVFLQVMATPRQLERIENIKFYLFRCLKNRIIYLQNNHPSFVEISPADDPAFSIQVTGLDLIEEKEEREQMAGYIEKLLNCLTNRQREAIYLRFMQEMSYEEISVLLNIIPKGARKLIYRSIERIKEENIPFFSFLLLLNYVIG